LMRNRPHIVVARPPNSPRTMDVRAKYFSPVRARLMRNRPHVSIAHPTCAAAPWM